MKKYLPLLSLLSLIFLIGCSSSEETVKKESEEIPKDINIETYQSSIEVEIVNLYAWVNFMPNADERFHISGELVIEESVLYDLSNLNLDLIKVYQEELLMFNIRPTVRQNPNWDEDDSINLMFSTFKGLLAFREFKTDKPIAVEFIFKDGNNEFKYLTTDVEVEETY